MLKEKVEHPPLFGRPEDFFEDEEGNQYRRIYGGLAWPSGSKPGAIVVVAESRKEDAVLKKHQYHVLRSQVELNTERLLRHCRDLSVRFRIEASFTDTSNKPMMDTLRRLRLKLYLREAPFACDSDGFRYYISLIQQLTDQQAKRLYFGDDKLLSATLMGIPQEKVKGTTAIHEFPLASALGFAVSALEAIVYNPNENQEVEYLNSQLTTEDD